MLDLVLMLAAVVGEDEHWVRLQIRNEVMLHFLELSLEFAPVHQAQPRTGALELQLPAPIISKRFSLAAMMRGQGRSE